MIPTRMINRNFRIKVNGPGISKLVGVTGLVDLIGHRLAEKLIQRAFENTFDILVCKLRRGLTVRFYAK